MPSFHILRHKRKHMSCVQPCVFLTPWNESNFKAAALWYTSAASAALWRVSATGPILTFFLNEPPHEKTAEVEWIVKCGNNFRTFQGRNCRNRPEWSWIYTTYIAWWHGFFVNILNTVLVVPALLLPQISWPTVTLCTGLPPVVEMASCMASTIHRSCRPVTALVGSSVKRHIHMLQIRTQTITYYPIHAPTKHRMPATPTIMSPPLLPATPCVWSKAPDLPYMHRRRLNCARSHFRTSSPEMTDGCDMFTQVLCHHSQQLLFTLKLWKRNTYIFLMYVYVLLQYFAHITGQPGISYRAKTFADFLASSFLLSFFESQSLNHFATISSCKKAITIAIK